MLVYVIRYNSGNMKYRYMIRRTDKSAPTHRYFDSLNEAIEYCDDKEWEIIRIRN